MQFTKGILLAVALGNAAPALAQEGFTAQTSQEFAAARPANPLARTLHAAERLRASIVINPAANLDKLTPGASDALSFALQSCCLSSSLAWFMRGAGVYPVAITPELLRIGYYNPLADIWIVTLWQAPANGELRMVYAQAYEGAAMTPGAQFWRDAPSPDFAQAIAASSSASRVRFATQDISMPGSAAVLLGQRASSWMLSVRAWMADTARRRLADRAHAALTDPRHQRFAPGSPSAAQLEAIDPEIRRTMSPLAAFTTPTSEVLVLVSPLRPQLLMIAEFMTRGLAPARLNALNLENLGSPGRTP
jgi:hypothetical protein